MKVFFLDRDGVVNIEKNYLYQIENFEFVDGVFEACRYIRQSGYQIIIITNQSGINRGYYTEQDFAKVTSFMIDEFKKQQIDILKVYHCPHTPEENCSCRKPKTGMIQKALKEFDIDLNNSYLVGDKFSDIECATNANISNTIQVQSGHKFDEGKSLAKFILPSLKDIEKCKIIS